MDERDRPVLEELRDYTRRAKTWSQEAGARWTDDEKTVAAVSHAIAQIGEITRRLSTATKAAHADVPWAAIAGMRNRIVHDYGHLDRDVLAETVRRDIPELLRHLNVILRRSADRGVGR